MTHPAAPEPRPPAGALRFGRIEIHAAERLLFLDGQPVPLGARAFDVLVALVERRDRVAGKNELLDAAWPGLVVEENNLQVQVTALRKALGTGAITTVPGRGYRFTVPAQAWPQSVTSSTVASGPAPKIALEPSPHDLVGRDADIAAIRALMPSVRVMSIVGAGGVGKTSLARALLAGRPDAGNAPGVAAWVELAPLTSGPQAFLRIAEILGVDIGHVDQARSALLESLARTSGLVVLDNCEHLLDEIAALVDESLQRATALRWLTTSQQPLRVRGEHVYRLDSLVVPPRGTPWPQAGTYSALALLAARARAAHRRFELDGSNIEVAIDLCHQLDGMPLAIEMAAARMPALGLRGVLERLGPRLMSLAGAGVAPTRQRTLRGALEWSHSLLSAPEQLAFLRLAPFMGGFSADLAEAVLAGSGLDAADALEALGTLVDKSLVQADDADPPRYRLLESTREFSQERLAASGEQEQVRDRHARALAARFAQAWDDFGSLPDLQWHAAHVVERSNVHSALAWMCGRDDPDATARLLALTGMLIYRTGVDVEFPDRSRALAIAENASADARADARLWSAYAEFQRADYGACNALWRLALAHYRNTGHGRGLVLSLELAARSLRRTRGKTERCEDFLRELDCIDARSLPIVIRLYVRWAKIDCMDDGEATIQALRDLIADCLRSGSYWLAAAAHANLTDQLLIAGDHASAGQEVTAFFQANRPAPPRPKAVMLGNRGAALVILGRHAEADETFRSVLRILPNFRITFFILFYQAYGAARRGRFREAALIDGFVTAYAARLDSVTRGAEARAESDTAAMLGAALPPDELARLRAQGAAMAPDEVLAIALPAPA